MRNSARKQNTDISRIIGILLLEVIAAILLLNLAGFAKQQRTQLAPEQTHSAQKLTAVEHIERARYPYPEASDFGHSFGDQTGKSLPKLANHRYNARR